MVLTIKQKVAFNSLDVIYNIINITVPKYLCRRVSTVSVVYNYATPNEQNSYVRI